jgi:hypothetical protein
MPAGHYQGRPHTIKGRSLEDRPAETLAQYTCTA